MIARIITAQFSLILDNLLSDLILDLASLSAFYFWSITGAANGQLTSRLGLLQYLRNGSRVLVDLLSNPIHLLRVLYVTMHLLADWQMVLVARPELIVDIQHPNLHQLVWWHVRLNYSVRQRHRLLQPFDIRRRSLLYLHWQVEFTRPR